MAVTTPVRIREGTLYSSVTGQSMPQLSKRDIQQMCFVARLAQLVERKTLNLVVVGSSPTVGKIHSGFFPGNPKR